jgi:site-specific DNA-methyltransferase (adenine-specific)
MIHHGDCLEVLKTLPDNSVDSIVTDPPYGLSFMGKRWDYDVPSEAIWRECLRVLKPGGHLLAFAGTRTQHRMAVRIEDAGFEIRDMIAWVYGSGFPKSHNLSGDWQGWGTALKPALEPITVARKPLAGTVAENVLTWGTGAINVDACRVAMQPGDGWNVPNADLRVVNPARCSAANGTPANVRHAEMRSTPAASGRWPANLIHDGSEEVVGLFPQTAGATSRTSTVSKGLFHGGDAGTVYPDSGSAARFFYCAKASKRDRDEGLEGFEEQRVGTMQDDAYRWQADGHGNKINLDTKRRNVHPTVKPTDLMRYLCRLVTPPGGTVLDPFTGSGSTGKACVLEGFNFIGIEREAEYVEIARARIARAALDTLHKIDQQLTLYDPEAA